jgi:sugar phosphate isomerase/epimerase
MYSERVRRMIDSGKELGFEVVGNDGSNHIVLRHTESGETTRIASSPGDYRGDKNAIALMQRISGKRLERHSHRKGRRPQRMAGYTKTVRTPSAESWSRRINELLEEHNRHWLKLQVILMPPLTNTDKNEALWLLRRLGEIETFLTELRQPLPEGNTTTMKRGLK